MRAAARAALATGTVAAWAWGASVPLPAQEAPMLVPEAPPVTHRVKPDLSELERLRFVTDNDYPPFNYLDEDGSLTGFNVDLARAICQELEIECELRAAVWEALLPALDRGEADAAVASIRTDEKTLLQADFTDSYYHTPARFAARRDSDIEQVDPEAVAGLRIAVVDATTHAHFLRDFYAEAEIVPFDSSAAARAALREGEVDLLFGDGISLMFWINGVASQGCCEFRGGPYTESRYFGEGVGIAVKRGNRKVREALDWGLDQVRLNGRFDELLLRYFPMRVF